MYFQTQMLSFSWIISLFIGFITLYLVRFYVKVFSLPKGPFPLPLIGNILIFRKTKVNQFITMTELHKTYGPVYTLWIGTTPSVLIGDYELAKKAFNSKNNELMGRPDTSIKQCLTQGNGSDVVFADHGPVWASLRRVAHSAVRKLAINENFAKLVDSVVEESVHVIKDNVGVDTPFDPRSYIYMTVFNIIASSAFGKRYSWNDKELKFFEENFEYFRKHNEAMAIPDRIPALKPFYYKTFNKVCKTVENISQTVRQKYNKRVENHTKGVIKDFCDALIEAKEEAICEEKESAPHLNDTNLSLVIANLFFAGSDTTQYMMRWIILLMANNIDLQKRMRQEIDDIIGDRMATHEDKNQCHFINAFIAETLRFRGVAPLGVPHRALVDYKLGDYNIKKDSFVFVNLFKISRNKTYFQDPDQFNPNRFLTPDGTFDPKITGFVPFGIGRRICLGEKLALIDLFLITVQLLKSTNKLLIELPGGEGTADLEPNPDVLIFSTPKPFEILFKTQ